MKRSMIISAVTVAVLSMASFAQASLVLHYAFDETGGNDVADSSGNGYDATITSGSGWLPTGGQYGGAVNVGGFRKTYLPQGSISNLTEVTVAAWIKGATDNASFFLACTSTNESGAARVIDLSAGPTKVEMMVGNNGGSYSTRSVVVDPTVNDPNAWEHWAMTFSNDPNNGGLGVITVFKNGVSVGVNANVETDRLLSGIMFAEIGKANDGTFKGQIDDFKLYDTALTATEIQNTVMIPEPATLGLVAIMGAGLIATRRIFGSK